VRKVTKIEANRQFTAADKLRVAAYCRVSTDNDDQQLSLEAQIQHYESYIKSDPAWELAGIYYDDGISGTKKENRTDLLRMLRDCENHRIDLIVTKSISRFARNTTDCLQIVRRLTELGVHISFEKENIHTGRMESELVLGILSSLAENESVSISQNNKWSCQHQFQNGTYKLANPPYGYDWDGEALVPNSEQSRVVQRIFAQAIEGSGAGRIASGLSADGIKPARGEVWGESSVRAILRNERYVGDAVFQKTYTDDRFVRHANNGEHPKYVIQSHHQAIVSRETFEAAAQAIAQRSKGKGIVTGDGKYTGRYAFSGKIICGECGSIFKRRIHHSGKPNQYVAWCCKTHLSGQGCSMLFVRDEWIKAAFVRAMNTLYTEKNGLLKLLIQTLKEQDTEGGVKLKKLDDLIQNNAERAKVLTGLVGKGYLTPALFNGKSNELKTEAAKLKEQRNALFKELSKVSEADELQKYLTRDGRTITEFDESLFIRFVSDVTVYSPTELGFRLKCGLVLKEEIER
jgi:site-specific DNA recombinase